MHLPRDQEAASVLQNLRELVHALRVTSHTVESNLGLSGAQLFVLRELSAEPNISLKRLSERTMTDPSSVSTVVARLVEQALITRSQDPKDRRRGVLTVSKKGQLMLKRAPQPYQVQLFASLKALPRTRLHQLHVGLEALLQHSTPRDGNAPLFFEGSPHPQKIRKIRV